MTHAVVIGGGSAGLLCAHLMAQREGHRVTLIEKEEQLGGLLGSHANRAGDVFDYGTHFMRDTPDPQLNQILFPSEWLEASHVWQAQEAGSFFAGKMDTQSPFLNTASLDPGIARQAEGDLIKACRDYQETNFENAAEQLTAQFGRGFVQSVFSPVLEKFFGVGLDHLAPNSHFLFGLSRLIAFSEDETRKLKQDPELDKRLAFHNNTDGQSGRMSYYPKSGGIGSWVEAQRMALQKLGVEIIAGRSVAKVEHQSGRVEGVTLNSGSHLDCDGLIWTVAPMLLLKAAATPFASTRPTIRKSMIFDFVVDRPLSNDLFYFTCYDPHFSLFRVTEYCNIQEQEAARSGRYRLTVEVLADVDATATNHIVQIEKELWDLGLFTSGSKILYRDGHDVLGFPVKDTLFAQSAAEQIDLINDRFSNVYLAGKASGAAFFMEEVFMEINENLRTFRP